MSKRKSYMKWSWIIIILFFVLSILDIRFGLLGFLCMLAPMYHALRGRGKVHCSSYCPRGSFLGKFLSKLSFQNTLPKWMRSKIFKHILLFIMMILFSTSLYHAGWDYLNIAFAIFRFMLTSFIVGILIGVFFKPRSWCQICPMGHATGLIRDAIENK
ncbi:MAG: 4Fe-4S binding protein [Epulopiscium sp.]|nr:4Fe-4S binding protein [Candidatus Epulonipiscium sp.]